MRKFLLFTVLVAVLVACASPGGNAEDKVRVEEKREVGDFREIVVKGTPTVHYRQGKVCSVTVEAPKGIVGDVKTGVAGTALVVEWHKRAGKSVRIFGSSSSGSGDVVVYVTSPDLTSAVLTGIGDFKQLGRLDTDNMRILLRGVGDMVFDDIICDRLEAELVGSGDITLKNVDAKETGLTLIGSGNMSANQKNVDKTSVLLKGSGDISVAFDNCGAVRSELLGSGDISFSGTVSTLNKSKRGSGDYNTGGLKTEHKR